MLQPLFPDFLVFLRYNQEKETKRKIRENNEHLVPRPFTSNNHEQIDIPPKHEDKLESKNGLWTMGLTEKGIYVETMKWA